MPAYVLWPERFPLYALMTLRATMTRAAFESEYQSNSHNPELCEWPEEYFQYPALFFDEWPHDIAIRAMAVDPSKGVGSKHGDDSAITLLAQDMTGVFYVDMDSRNDRGAEIIVDTVVEHYQTFHPDVIGVETNDFQNLFVILFQQRAGTIPLPILELDNTVNKMVRIRRLGAFLAQRLIRFKRQSRGSVRCVQQAKDFKGDPRDHDDMLDSLEMAIRSLIQVWNGRFVNPAGYRL